MLDFILKSVSIYLKGNINYMNHYNLLKHKNFIIKNSN